MYNFFKTWSPVLMVVFTATGMILHLDNSNMFNAYLTGFTGWLVVATNEFFPERSKYES